MFVARPHFWLCLPHKAKGLDMIGRILMTIVVSVLLVQGVGTSQSTPSPKNTAAIVRQKELRDLEAWIQNSSEPTAENQNPTRRNGKNHQTSVSFSDAVFVDSLTSSLPDVMVSTMVRTFTEKEVTSFEREDYCHQRFYPPALQFSIHRL